MGALPLSIGFRLDAGASVGNGHLIRCATLADEMSSRGWWTKLYGTRETASLAAAASFSAVQELSRAGANDPAAFDKIGRAHV